MRRLFPIIVLTVASCGAYDEGHDTTVALETAASAGTSAAATSTTMSSPKPTYKDDVWCADYINVFAKNFWLSGRAAKLAGEDSAKLCKTADFPTECNDKVDETCGLVPIPREEYVRQAVSCAVDPLTKRVKETTSGGDLSKVDDASKQRMLQVLAIIARTAGCYAAENREELENFPNCPSTTVAVDDTDAFLPVLCEEPSTSLFTQEMIQAAVESTKDEVLVYEGSGTVTYAARSILGLPQGGDVYPVAFYDPTGSYSKAIDQNRIIPGFLGHLPTLTRGKLLMPLTDLASRSLDDSKTDTLSLLREHFTGGILTPLAHPELGKISDTPPGSTGEAVARSLFKATGGVWAFAKDLGGGVIEETSKTIKGAIPKETQVAISNQVEKFQGVIKVLLARGDKAEAGQRAAEANASALADENAKIKAQLEEEQANGKTLIATIADAAKNTARGAGNLAGDAWDKTTEVASDAWNGTKKVASNVYGWGVNKYLGCVPSYTDAMLYGGMYSNCQLCAKSATRGDTAEDQLYWQRCKDISGNDVEMLAGVGAYGANSNAYFAQAQQSGAYPFGTAQSTNPYAYAYTPTMYSGTYGSLYGQGTAASATVDSTTQTGTVAASTSSNCTVEVCNGRDDDCDGLVDNNVTGTGTSCTADGLGQCTLGTMECVGGSLRCDPGTPTAETCDGLDNDCDGQVDNVAGCSGNGSGGVEVCNGLDDDGDGIIDNGNPGGGADCSYPSSTGIGLPGLTACANGALECAPVIPAAMIENEGMTANATGDGQGSPLGCAVGATATSSPLGALPLLLLLGAAMIVRRRGWGRLGRSR